jgi:hypothetical protein
MSIVSRSDLVSLSPDASVLTALGAFAGDRRVDRPSRARQHLKALVVSEAPLGMGL